MADARPADGRQATRSDGAVRSGPPVAGPLRHERDGRRRRVLLVEDERGMRELLAMMLRRDGYGVVEARDGAEFLEHMRATAESGEPASDLVISDIRLPVLSGLEALAVLRRAGYRTPVILLTAFGDEQTHAEARELGATVFDKPFPLDDLRHAVREVLDRSTHRLALDRKTAPEARPMSR